MARDGQQRIEVRPGAFVWFDKADADAFRAHQAGTSTTTETASVTTTTAVLPAAKATKRGQKP